MAPRLRPGRKFGVKPARMASNHAVTRGLGLQPAEGGRGHVVVAGKRQELARVSYPCTSSSSAARVGADTCGTGAPAKLITFCASPGRAMTS